MKIQLDANIRKQLDDFLPSFRSGIDALAETTSLLADVAAGNEKNHVRATELAKPNFATDKQLMDRVICRERERALNDLREKYQPIEAARKQHLVKLANEAAALVRTAAGNQIFERNDAFVTASLPESVRNDQNLLFRILSESQSKRNIGSFLNALAVNRNDDSMAILSAAERQVQLLESLLSDRGIVIPGVEATADSN